MTPEADGYLEERRPRGHMLARLKDLSLAEKLELAGGTLLLCSLFLTWQHLEIDFGPAGKARLMLDGWDALGLVIALLTLVVLTLVVIVDVSDVDVSPDVPWKTIVLGLAAGVLAVTLLKNVTDESSTWVSYAGVLLAGAVAAGALADWAGVDLSGSRRLRRRRFR